MRPTDTPDRSAATLLAHGGMTPDANDGSVVSAWQPSATFARDHTYALRDARYNYARYDSPSWEPAESLIATLESGADARLFASGTAAGAAIVQALKPGDRVVAPRVMYHGLRAWMIDYCAEWGLQLDFFDANTPGSLATTLAAAPTALLWIETPCNPTWDIVDIAEATWCSTRQPNTSMAIPMWSRALPCAASPMTSGSGWLPCVAARAAFSAASRPGCCSAGCAPCRCGCAPRAITRSPSRNTSTATPR